MPRILALLRLIRIRCEWRVPDSRHDLCCIYSIAAAMEAFSTMNRSRSFGVLIALGFTASAVMLILVAGVGYFSISSLWNNAHKTGQTYEVIDRLSELTSMLQDAETGQRGYLLTGNDTYLEPYRLAEASIDNVTGQLRDLTADNPAQARRLEQALPLIQSKMAELKQTIELRRTDSMDAALKVVVAGQGKTVMDNIGQLVLAMENEERNSLRIDKARTDFSANLSETTIISASLLALIITGLVGWYLTSSLTRQIGSAAAVLQSS